MKRTRGICLLFILITFAVVVMFWFGYLFGKESQRQADLVKITEAQLEANANKKPNDVKNEDDTSFSDSNDAGTNVEDDHSIVTHYEYAQPQFYLKAEEEYVSVYVFATDELYFETDILVMDLPMELQEDLEDGLEFYNLESVYIFLENYSS